MFEGVNMNRILYSRVNVYRISQIDLGLVFGRVYFEAEKSLSDGSVTDKFKIFCSL